MPNIKTITRSALLCSVLSLLNGCSSSESEVVASEEEARAYAESVAPPELVEMINSASSENEDQ